MTHRLIGCAALMLASAGPAMAQDHDHAAMDHSAHTEPAASRPQDEADTHDHGAPEAEEIDHSAMDHSGMDHSAMDHSGMDEGDVDHSAMDHAAMGHTMPPPARNAPPPPRAFEGPRHAADSVWGAQAMRPTRVLLGRENGGFRTGSVLFERLEMRLGNDRDYVWEGQAFWGGDIDRLVLKTEGKGAYGGGGVASAEVQALWSRAILPFIDLQAGTRVDLAPDARAHAVLGLQGTAPFWIHFDTALFLSETGDLTARIEAEYDQRITQRLIIQPRVELNLAAQAIPERGTGAGVSDFELGLRLRYEIVREFAPYVGLDWQRRVGEGADFARSMGESPSSVALLIGLRSWF